MTLLFWLLVGHAVADYPLQGDFLSKGKNRFSPLPGVPWWICLAAHALIHAGVVAHLTGSVALGLAEFFIHVVIDDLKCGGHTTFTQDQALHVACKVLYVVIVQ